MSKLLKAIALMMLNTVTADDVEPVTADDVEPVTADEVYEVEHRNG